MAVAAHEFRTDPLLGLKVHLPAQTLFLANAVAAALTLAQARADGVLSGSLPLVTYGAATAAILATVAIASGLVALVPTYLWSLGLYPSVEPIFYRTWFWGLGHTLQYVNVTAMIAVWYTLAALTFKASPINEKFTRVAFTLYIFFTVPVLGHHFLVDPTLSPWSRSSGGASWALAWASPA